MPHPIVDRRSVLQGGAFAAAGLVAPAILSRHARAEDNVLYVNTWGGSWTAAEDAAFYKPFTEATGIRIRPVAPVSYAKLKAQVQSGNYEWDISTLNSAELRQAEQENLVDKIDAAALAPADLPANTIYRNEGIGTVALGTCLAYRKDKFPNGGPQSWADFWDVKKFPGTRSLYTRSFTILAFALVADGVPVDKVYPLDLDRAFKKLDEIKPHIKVWWTEGSQSQQLIRDGEVDMISIWNARAQELIDKGAPIELVWNGAENYETYFYVAKGTPRAKIAWQFATFSAQPKRIADFCTRLAYGPLNPKAFDYIAEDTARKMPTWPPHKQVSFVPDPDWLAPRLGEMKERWTQWLAT